MLSSRGSKKPKPLSVEALRRFILKALDRGWMQESFHSEVERADRNISDDDLRFGLEAAWTLQEVRYSEVHSTYSYTLATVDIDDEELHIVVSPLTEKRILKVITKW
jgi:hypothetical protein